MGFGKRGMTRGSAAEKNKAIESQLRVCANNGKRKKTCGLQRNASPRQRVERKEMLEAGSGKA